MGAKPFNFSLLIVRSSEGLHNLGRIFCEIHDNQICDPASAGFFKAVRFGRYASNGLVRWAFCEGLHIWAACLFFYEVLENQTCGPAPAGVF